MITRSKNKNPQSEGMLGKRAAPEQLKLDQCWAKKDVELLQARCSIIKKQYYSALETKIKMQSKLPSVQP
jgi:hypothetical protein